MAYSPMYKVNNPSALPQSNTRKRMGFLIVGAITLTIISGLLGNGFATISNNSANSNFSTTNNGSLTAVQNGSQPATSQNNQSADSSNASGNTSSQSSSIVILPLPAGESSKSSSSAPASNPSSSGLVLIK